MIKSGRLIAAFLITLMLMVGAIGALVDTTVKETPQPAEVATVMPERSYERVVWDSVQGWKLSQYGYSYKVDSRLCDYALTRVGQIKTDWSHEPFIKKHNLFKTTEYHYVGENLSRNFPNPGEVLSAWLNSEAHRKVLNDPYTHSCLKCDGTYCVQIFGSV